MKGPVIFVVLFLFACALALVGLRFVHVCDSRRYRRVKELASDFPRIVCLCGSTRFWRTFQEVGLVETLAGRIVLSIGAASGTDDEHFAGMRPEAYNRVKADLDRLHFRKIELADEILVLNVGQYIGESTRKEIYYAARIGKRIRYFEVVPGHVYTTSAKSK